MKHLMPCLQSAQLLTKDMEVNVSTCVLSNAFSKFSVLSLRHRCCFPSWVGKRQGNLAAFFEICSLLQVASSFRT